MRAISWINLLENGKMDNIFPWCEEIWTNLLFAKKKNRFPHAILFHGNNGVGKSELAFQLAHYLLCASPTKNEQPCLICKDCVLFSAGTHGDFYNISPEENSKNIGIDQIRNLKIAAHQKPQRNNIKIFVIANANKMTISAANALLKVLEEPPGDSIFILTSERKHFLSPTILSRCHQYQFSSPSDELTEQWLLSDPALVFTKEIIKDATFWSLGSPLLAQKLLKDGVISEYQTCLAPLLAFFSKKESLAFLSKSWQGKSLVNILYVSQVACYYLLKGTWTFDFNKKRVYQWSRKIIDIKKMTATGIALNEALLLDMLLAE